MVLCVKYHYIRLKWLIDVHADGAYRENVRECAAFRYVYVREYGFP